MCPVKTKTIRKYPAPSNPSRTSDGILVVDKPEGITSHDVVARVKKWLQLKKVGHCGALDPLATGVLVLCVNQATKIADQLLMQDKTYRFTLQLGIRTDTQDKMGKVIESYTGPPLERTLLEELLPRFTGRIRQRVPRYAAVKVGGRRLYSYARAGVDVELPWREVTLYRLELIDYQWPEAILEAHTSKGTYIRQLADDLGEALGCGAHVSALTRIASGPFDLRQAVTLDQIKTFKQQEQWQTKLVSIHDALAHLPAVIIDDPDILRRLRNGHLDTNWEVQHRKKMDRRRDVVRLTTPEGHLLALWWPTPITGQRRLRVFDPRQ